MKPEFVSIASFNTTPDAETLKSLLLAGGIDARVKDETRLQKFWFVAEPKAGVHVQVPKDSLVQAQRALNEPQLALVVQKAVHCPSCDSLRVQYPDLTRKNILPTLLAQLFVLLHISKHKYYCEDCHFTWPGTSGIAPGTKSPAKFAGFRR